MEINNSDDNTNTTGEAEIDGDWEQSKLRKLLIVVMGFIATLLGIYFPQILSSIDPNVTINIGGTNLAFVFLFSSPLIGYYIGEMANPGESSEEFKTSNDYGYAVLGIFFGLIGALSLTTYFFKDELTLVIQIGLFGVGGVLAAFLANITNFIKNKPFSEEKLKQLFKFVGIIGMYQYLLTSYLFPAISHLSYITIPILIVFLIIAIVLALFFFQELRELIPNSVSRWIQQKLDPS